MDQLSIHHKDVLMKMFMYSLDGCARKWYRTLPTSSISSLKDFHDSFYSYCKRIYLAECLFEHCCRGYALYIQGLVVDSSSSKDEVGGYAMKNEEDLLSSSNSVLQEEIFQNSVIKVDDSIIEQKSSSLEIDQDAPIYDKYNDDKANVVSFDITSNVNIAPYFYEGQPVFDEYLDEELQTSTLTRNQEHFYDVHKDILEQQIATSAFVDIFNNDILFDSNRLGVEEGSDKELLEPFIQSSSVEQYFSEISQLGFTEDKQ